MIICEGSQTEPLYFNAIRQALRLPTVNVQVLPSKIGTEPSQVVQYAQQVFENGIKESGIEARAFDRIYAVFDRDSHLTYVDARQQAQALDRKLKNNLGSKVTFQTIVSVPCFELWLLLHFKAVSTPAIDRKRVLKCLKKHFPDYAKGCSDIYQKTQDRLQCAIEHAKTLALPAKDATWPYTNVHELVEVLRQLKERIKKNLMPFRCYLPTT